MIHKIHMIKLLPAQIRCCQYIQFRVYSEKSDMPFETLHVLYEYSIKYFLAQERGVTGC
jgi:hypothetical protein